MKIIIRFAAIFLFAFVVDTVCAEPVIQSISINGTVEFSSEDDATAYRIEWAPSVSGPWTNSWDRLNDIPPNGVGTITSSVPMFYRVVKVTNNSLDYLIIDLSAGPSATNYPITALPDVPSGGWTDEYKTSKLVLRRISSGVFTMGSPTNEIGRGSDETAHTVVLTQEFYMGIFEVTQKQWERVMGTHPSWFTNETYRDSRPVEQVSYYDIRGMNDWPSTTSVSTTSFIGRLQQRTGLLLDLPSENQWEYSARAGSSAALSSGLNLTNSTIDTQLDTVARYLQNHPGGYSSSRNATTASGSASVGSFQPNAWGLFDVHGNVMEWCLDWRDAYPLCVGDLPTPISGSSRVMRGGSWDLTAGASRSAWRSGGSPNLVLFETGFRVAIPVEP